MDTKEKYLKTAEIKVKSLLSDLYETESATQEEIGKTQDRLNQKIEALESRFELIKKKRNELQKKFTQLQYVAEDKWKTAKEEFDLLLDYIEGDKETFIHKAELIIDNISEQIIHLENRIADSATELKADLKDRVFELSQYKMELQEKLDKVKKGSTDKLHEFSQWFVEKTAAIKEYLSFRY
ncbi:MAG: hemagglutinin [Bacteroidales bacterium]|nr:hemagglutinin [Bacteroidales bacterium]